MSVEPRVEFSLVECTVKDHYKTAIIGNKREYYALYSNASMSIAWSFGKDLYSTKCRSIVRPSCTPGVYKVPLLQRFSTLPCLRSRYLNRADCHDCPCLTPVVMPIGTVGPTRLVRLSIMSAIHFASSNHCSPGILRQCEYH